MKQNTYLLRLKMCFFVFFLFLRSYILVVTIHLHFFLGFSVKMETFSIKICSDFSVLKCFISYQINPLSLHISMSRQCHSRKELIVVLLTLQCDQLPGKISLAPLPLQPISPKQNMQSQEAWSPEEQGSEKTEGNLFNPIALSLIRGT